MKLDWRKVVCIVIFAELLLIYWNSIGIMQSRKPQAGYPSAVSTPELPVTRMESPAPAMPDHWNWPTPIDKAS